MALDLLYWCRLDPSNIRLPLSRHFYPEWLTVMRAYTCLSMGHPGDLNPLSWPLQAPCSYQLNYRGSRYNLPSSSLPGVDSGMGNALWLLHVEIEWIDLARFPILSERRSLLFYVIHFYQDVLWTLHRLNSSIWCLWVAMVTCFHSHFIQCCLEFIHVLLKNYKKTPRTQFVSVSSTLQRGFW